MEKELANANDLLEVSRQHERQLTCHDDAEIVSSAAANVSRLIKSGMTLTQVCSLSFRLLGLCLVFTLHEEHAVISLAGFVFSLYFARRTCIFRLLGLCLVFTLHEEHACVLLRC